MSIRENKKKESQGKKRNIRERLTNILELPKEIVLNVPLITITGSQELSIENYKGIVEYSEEKIRVNTSCGIVKIEGIKLSIKQITQENLIIIGKITKFEYMF